MDSSGPGQFSHLLEGLGAGVGVLLGILVGVVISICVRRWEQRQARNAQFASMTAEMRFNVGRIEVWIEELARCRAAITEDRLHDWYGFFDLHSSIFRVADTVLTSGLIHERLDSELIVALQVAAGDLSVTGAQHMNGQFSAERDRFEELRAQTNYGLWMRRKPEALQLVEYWENRLGRHRATFTAAIGALQSVGRGRHGR